MPGATNDLLWTSSNDYDSEVKYKKGTTIASKNQGVCAGLAIEWCKNILNGIAPEKSKPHLMRGMILQRYYDWGKGIAESNNKLFTMAEVTAGEMVKGNSAHTTAGRMWPRDGTWWGGYDVHAVAVAKPAGKPWLFYDPNYGCYAVHSELRLTKLFRQGRNAVGAEFKMEFFQISLN